MNYVVGIKTNGERIRFERWVYECWREGNLRDEFLVAGLRACIGFTVLY